VLRSDVRQLLEAYIAFVQVWLDAIGNRGVLWLLWCPFEGGNAAYWVRQTA